MLRLNPGILWATLLVFILTSCERPEHTSVAVQVSETFETEVIQHPTWTKKSIAVTSTWADLLAGFELVGSRAIWRSIQDLEFDLLVLDLPITRVSRLQNCLEPIDSYMVLQKDSVKRIISEANGHGIHVLFNWDVEALGKKNPWLTQCPECFVGDTLDDGKLAYYPLFTQPELSQIQKKAITQWVDSCGFNGYYSRHSSIQPLLFWEELIRSFESRNKTILAFTDNFDPTVHSVAFHASRNHTFEDLFNENSLHFIKQKSDEMIRHEIEQFLVNAYRLHHLKPEADSSHAANIQPLKTVFAYTSKSLPVCEGLYWIADSTHTFVPKFKSGLDPKLVAMLGQLKVKNEVLWNGFYGGKIEMKDTKSLSLIAFSRFNKEDEVLTMMNCSEQPVRVELSDPVKHEYVSIDDKAVLFSQHTNGTLVLKPFSYWVFIKQKSRFGNEPG